MAALVTFRCPACGQHAQALPAAELGHACPRKPDRRGRLGAWVVWVRATIAEPQELPL